MPLDTLIHNGTIVTVNPGFDIIEDGLVGVKGGIITRVEKRLPDAPLPDTVDILDARGGLILPGLVNTHTHLPMTLFRGLADDLPLETWLNEHIFPAESRFIDPASVRLGTRLACAEMLLSGTTTFCDGYFYETEVAGVVHSCGMRAILGQGVIDFPAPGVPDPAQNVACAMRFVEEWLDASPLIHPSIFCHSPYTCSENTLRKSKQAAADRNILFQIHVAETEGERSRTIQETGDSPVRYLDRLEVLDSRTLSVHCVWLDDEDIAQMARRETAVAHCPESSMKLAAGIAPVPGLQKAGITVGLGTDGCASNNNHDLFTEMDTAAKLHKVCQGDPSVMDARTVLRMATIDGARAVGLADRIGSIETGKQADLIVVDTDRPHLVPMFNPVSHLVYAVNGSDVRDVMVGGSWLVRQRRLETVDAGAVMAEMRQMAARIKKG